MNFFLSTDLVIGVNEALKLNEHLSTMPIAKPAIIYDANVASSLYFQEVLKNLQAAFPNAVTYCNDFAGEPTYAHLENVATMFRSKMPDAVVAIGGGSTLDLGKGIALLMTNDVPHCR
jgi:alcohol dehydrogenase